MSLKQLTLDVVSTAFKIVDDLAETVTFRKHDSQTYDVQTGTVSERDTDYPVKAVLSRFTEQEMDEEVNILTDIKCLIPAKDLPVVPDKDDEIIDHRGDAWDVIKTRGVPGESLWICHIRKKL